jgi:hypothetical protein
MGDLSLFLMYFKKASDGMEVIIFFFNIDVYISLRESQLILQILKLIII